MIEGVSLIVRLIPYSLLSPNERVHVLQPSHLDHTVRKTRTSVRTTCQVYTGNSFSINVVSFFIRSLWPTVYWGIASFQRLTTVNSGSSVISIVFRKSSSTSCTSSSSVCSTTASSPVVQRNIEEAFFLLALYVATFMRPRTCCNGVITISRDNKSCTINIALNS